MRRVLLIAGICLAIVVAGLVAFVFLIDVNQYRGRIQAELGQKLGRPVELGTMGLRLIPLSIAADNVTIGESPAFPTGRPFATVKQVRVHASLLPLLRKEVRVQSVDLSQPSIELVKNAAGVWNFSTLGDGSGNKRPDGGEGGGGGFSLDRLSIEDGRIALTDLANRGSRSVYDHIDVALTDLGPGKEFHVNASAHLPGSGKESLTLQGNGGPMGSGPAPFQGRLAVQQASLAALESFLSSGARGKVDGRVSGTADVQSANSVLTARGGLDFSDLRVRSSPLAYPVRLDFDLNDDLKSGLLTARAVKVNVGKVPVSISGTMNTKASTVDARVLASRASLAEVLSLARALGAGDMSGSGIVSLDVRVQGPFQRSDALNYSGGGSLENASLNLPSLAKPLGVRTAALRFDRNTASIENLVCSLGSSTMRGGITARNFSAPDVGFNLNIDKLNVAELQQLTASKQQPSRNRGGSRPIQVTAKGTLDVGSIDYNGLVLNRVHSGCALSNGVLTLDPLTADVFGGKQSGSITVDTRPQPSTVAVKSTLDGVDANQMLSATTSMKNRLYGLLGAGANASMALVPGNDIARTLNGNLSVKLVKGRLVGFNLMNEMASLAKFMGYAQSNQAHTNITLLAGDMNVRDGVASTDNLRVQMDGASVAAAGTVNLVNQAMNLHLTTVLDRAMSQKVGGNQIGGFLTTALANKNGELVIPAIATGTLEHPVFAPDASRMAEMKLKNLLPTAGNPGALTSGVVGAITGQKGAGSSILDSITGKQPNPQQGASSGAKQPNASDQTGSILGAIDQLTRKPEKKEQQKKP